jgi:glycosyltransferase involved in cell wall biosynthesis
MRICHVITSLALGGAERQLLRFINNDEANHHTVCYLGFDDALRGEYESSGVEVISMGGSSKTDVFAVLARLIFHLRSEEYDIIHARQPHGMVFARLANIFAGRKPVVSRHGNIKDSYDPIFKELERLTRRFNDVTTGISNAVVDSFTDQREPTRADWPVIYNGLNCKDWKTSLDNASIESANISDDLGLSDSQFVFLNVGRYVPQKNQALLIAATEQLVSTHPDVQVILVGWGRLEDDYRQLIEDLNLESNVIITGRVSQPVPYYALADCFVLCSDYEGLGNVLIEAAATGLPLIGTDVPGISEVIVDGVNGYIIDPGDADQLADAMRRMISSNRRDSFAKASFELCREQFDISNVVHAYNTIYDSLT